MSLVATVYVWKLTGLSPTQKLVLLSLADRAGEDHIYWLSLNAVAKDCCLSIPEVQRVIDELCDGGLLSKSDELKLNLEFLQSTN